MSEMQNISLVICLTAYDGIKLSCVHIIGLNERVFL